MNRISNALLSVMVASLLCVAHPTSYAGQRLPCWIERIEQREGKIHVVFQPGYRQRAYIPIESQEGKRETLSGKPPEYLILSEDERAVISDGLHSGCEMVAERRHQLGLLTRSYVTIPNLPADIKAKFIPATEQN